MMYNIKHVHIQKSVRDCEAASGAAKMFRPEQLSFFEDIPSIPEGSGSKENLILRLPKGELLKPCPCTAHYTGCGYTVLNYIQNCPLTCTYCILQAYLNSPGITLFPDFARIKRELYEKVLKPEKHLRIGTGELGDSLALEPISGISSRLVEYMASCECSVLELKTKTAEIESLLQCDPKGRTVVGWSINAPYIIEHEEKDTASLEERLQAASMVRDAGYLISFHLDPVISFPGWETEYQTMFTMLGDCIGAGTELAWISIGGMRFMPELKRIINCRYPDSIAASGEFIKGADGKKRYYKKIRSVIFKTLYTYAKDLFPRTPVYFCMESEEIWREAAGYYPGPQGVKKMLDNAVGI